MAKPVTPVKSLPSTSRGTLITTSSNSATTDTIWEFALSGASVSPTKAFRILTRSNVAVVPGTNLKASNVLDASLRRIDIWLPPFTTYTVRVKQLENGVFTEWSNITTFESRGTVNSAENFTILNTGSTTIS